MRRLILVGLCVGFIGFTLSGCGFILSKLPRPHVTRPADERTQRSQEATKADDGEQAAQQQSEVVAGARGAEKGESSDSGDMKGTVGEDAAAVASSVASEAGATPATSPPQDEETVVRGTLPSPQGSGTRRVRYIPIGAQRKLTTADLRGLSKWQLDILRNEIYAAHGRPFARADLRHYFRRQSWYVEDPGFTEARLSALEKRNAAFIADYQRGRGQTRGGSSGGSSGGGGGFVLPFSSSRKVTVSDLRGLSHWELDIARNEIYARHGRPFARADLRRYFRSRSWYVEDPGFTEGRLSSLEKRNAEFIREYQGR